MNIIQAQSRLQELPQTPQTAQLLVNYANGVDPEVPPWLALAEITRRKKLSGGMPASPPVGTVKDKIEQEAGLAALQQKMAESQAQALAQGKLGAAPANPATTGIATAPTQPGTLNFAPGGIVAFARGSDEDGVDEDDETDDETDDEETGAAEKAVSAEDVAAFDPVRQFLELQRRAQAREAAPGPKAVSPLALQEQLAKKDPEMYGMLNKPAGREYLEGIRKLQAAQEAESARQREDIEAGRRSDFWKALIDAGESTRGQRGIGALLGGFGRSMISSGEQRTAEEAAIRSGALKRQELLNAAQFEVDKLQRAQAEGDVKAEYQHNLKLAEIAGKLGVSVNNLLRGQVTAAGNIIGKQISAGAQTKSAELRAAATKEAARIRAAAIANRPEKATDFDKMVKVELNAAIANGADPKDPAVLLAAYKNAAYTLGKQASTIGAEATKQEKINKEVQNRLLLGSEGKKLRELKAKGDTAAMAAFENEVRRKVEQEFGAGPATSATPAPAAPAGAGRKPLSSFVGQ